MRNFRVITVITFDRGGGFRSNKLSFKAKNPLWTCVVIFWNATKIVSENILTSLFCFVLFVVVAVVVVVVVVVLTTCKCVNEWA